MYDQTEITHPKENHMSQNNADFDPLAGALKKPAVSWKHEPVGTVRVFQVQSSADVAQTTDFATKLPAFWKLKPGQTEPDPKLAAVFEVFDEKEQEERTLWAPIPSSMRTALAEAQKAAGELIGAGGTLTIKFTGTKPSGKGEDQKLYAAKYDPPKAAPKPDPLASGPSDPWATPAAPATDEPPF